MAKEIIFKISPDGGKVDVEAEGFTGGSCTDFAEKTLKALGSITDEGKKKEFFTQGGQGIGLRS